MRSHTHRPERSVVDDILPVVEDIRRILAELRALASQVKDPDGRQPEQL